MTRCLRCDRLIARGSRCAPCMKVIGQRRNEQRGEPTGYGWQRVRAAIIERDGGCVMADRTCDGALEIDHIIELADGGATGEGNLRVLCKSHHRRKTNAARVLRARQALAQRRGAPEGIPGAQILGANGRADARSLFLSPRHVSEIPSE